jgi:hypothetical protein
MKLRRITVSSYRSLFDFTPGGAPLELECSDGMNLLIGPNNCGKSNVVRAIELALEPEATISAERDLPGKAARARPTVVLQFQVGRNDPAADLVRKVQHLRNSGDEQGSRDGSTTLTFRVRFERDAEQGTFRRRADFGFPVPDDKRDALDKAVRLFHERVRFVITRSGESLESILEGKFREVLRDVVSETLRQEYEQAIGRRESYLDDLQAALFKPLTDQVAADLSTIFPEVNAVELRPNIPEIDATIANLSVQVADSAITDLASKGTGLRGGVIAAMFRYLATHSRHSMVFAVEEPESFLHPAAQESLRENLEQLAERDEITVIATTHSPFMVPRRQDATLFALTKDASGATRLEATARGDEQRATLIGGLFRDPQVSYVLDSVQQVPPDAVGVLVVEGTTDVSFLRTAARLLGRRSLDGVHLVASSGAGAAATQAVVLQAGCSVPVCAIFDNDGNGKAAFDRLRGSTFGKLIRPGTVLNYRVAFPDLDQSLPFESEDLFSTALHAAFAERYPEGQVVLVDRAPGVTHPEFHYTLKEEFAAFVDAEATAEDCERWHRIFDAIDKALGRPVEERPPRPAPKSDVSTGSAESAAVQRPTTQPTPTALEPPDPPKSSERRRPTPLESELNGSKPETRRVKELLDAWAAAGGVEVEAKDRSYAYLFNKKIVTRLWPAFNAIDAHLDHLDDSPASEEIRAKIGELSGKAKELAPKKRQVATSHVVARWDWFRDVLLEPRRQSLLR